MKKLQNSVNQSWAPLFPRFRSLKHPGFCVSSNALCFQPRRQQPLRWRPQRSSSRCRTPCDWARSSPADCPSVGAVMTSASSFDASFAACPPPRDCKGALRRRQPSRSTRCTPSWASPCTRRVSLGDGVSRAQSWWACRSPRRSSAAGRCRWFRRRPGCAWRGAETCVETARLFDWACAQPPAEARRASWGWLAPLCGLSCASAPEYHCPPTSAWSAASLAVRATSAHL